MKKLVVILSSLVVMLSFSACNSENQDAKLQSEYDSLKQSYDSLKADYDQIKSEKPAETSEQSAEITESNSEVESSSEVLPLEIEDYGYYMNGKFLYCSVIIHNPNKNIMCEFPSYRVTARDADNVILGSKDHTLCRIYPEQSISFSMQFFECDEAPAKVEVEALGVEEYKMKKVGLPDVPNYKPFEITNTAVREGKVVGEITNPNSDDFSRIAVTVVFRDDSGKIVGGETSYVSDLKANSTIPFQISTDIFNCPVTNNYELTAQIWI